MLIPGTAPCPKGDWERRPLLQAVTQLISFLFLLWLPGNSGLGFSEQEGYQGLQVYVHSWLRRSSNSFRLIAQ